MTVEAFAQVVVVVLAVLVALAAIALLLLGGAITLYLVGGLFFCLYQVLRFVPVLLWWWGRSLLTLPVRFHTWWQASLSPTTSLIRRNESQQPPLRGIAKKHWELCIAPFVDLGLAAPTLEIETVTLRLEPCPTAAQLTAALKAQVLTVHPDKGGTDRATIKALRAHEYLSAPGRIQKHLATYQRNLREVLTAPREAEKKASPEPERLSRWTRWTRLVLDQEALEHSSDARNDEVVAEGYVLPLAVFCLNSLLVSLPALTLVLYTRKATHGAR